MTEGRVAIGALILLAAWLLIGLPWLLSPSERIEYRDVFQAAAQNTEALPKGSRNSPFFVEVIPTPKSAKEQAEETEDREEKRSSDRWLVRWTFALFAATIGLILATLGLGYFAYRQSRDMRESIDVASRSANEASRSANIAERALTELERPWIFVQLSPRLVSHAQLVPENPDEAIDLPPVAVFEISNHGRMPAIVRSCHIALEGVPATTPSAGILRDEFHMSLGPQERSEKLHVDCPGGLATYGVVVDLITEQTHPVPELSQDENFFFYIVIVYEDVRGGSHTSSFCWRFDLGVNYWVQFGGSNYNYLT